ncbi:MAG: tagaturonate epimerase family protein [Bacteroidales bacterium]
MLIEKYSFGMGDRFGKEGRAQLAAIQEINKLGYNVVPVWNKSYREHTIVKTDHSAVAHEAAEAVKANGWTGNFYVDADHIGLAIVDQFIDHSNFFTIDVAHFIGKPSSSEEKQEFITRYSKYIGKLSIPGIQEDFEVTQDLLASIADKFLMAIKEVKTIYNHIASKKGADKFIPEVSMDECDIAQTPIELFFILAELKHRGVEVQTIAPKFTGLFAKGVDYEGNIDLFAKEFEQDVAVIQFVIKELGLPKSLKLSVHSGSDKFAIYPIMRKALEKFDAGIHVKTAGTTWLEEVIGLAQADGEGLEIAKTIYEQSMTRYDELAGPYATVLHIDKSKLPSVDTVNAWNSKQFSDALTHNQACKDFNPHFRQLIHVGYKIAAELGDRYMNALEANRSVIEKNVKYNLLDRHLKLLFNVQ